MPLPALAGLLGSSGGLSAAGGILGGLGSIIGGGKQKDAADDMLNFAKNMQSFVHDLGGRHAQSNRDNARAASRSSGKIINDTRDEQLGIAAGLRRRSGKTAAQARDRNLQTLTGARNDGLRALGVDRRAGLGAVAADRRAGLGEIRADRRAGLGEIAADRTAGIGDINRARRQNMRTARGTLAASLGYFDPAIGVGNNALSAMADTLGIGNGGFRMEMTPATKYLMEQGRTTVEGGAAGAGGLYSGETLGELEKMRMGLAAQDRDTQLAQLFGLVGVGQAAGNSAAGVRGDFRDAATGIRNTAAAGRLGVRDNATGRAIGVRDTATGRAIGVRDNATGRGIDVRDNATGRGIDVRNTATAGSNALRNFYAPQIAGVNDTFADRIGQANTNFANMSTNAQDVWAQRGLANIDNTTNRFIDSRNNALNAYIGAMSTTSPMVGQGITNKGDAGAAQFAGFTRGLGNALGDFAYMRGQQGSGAAPGVPPLPGGRMPSLY